MNESINKRKLMIDITLDKEGNIKTNLCVNNQANISKYENGPIFNRKTHLFE